MSHPPSPGQSAPALCHGGTEDGGLSSRAVGVTSSTQPRNATDPFPDGPALITPADCLRWYGLNAACERSGNVWMRDDTGRKYGGPSPLYVAAEHEGVRYASGTYGRMERRAAWCLGQLLRRDLPLVPYEALGISESTVDLGDSQIEALGTSCGVPVSVITGGPGTGKTTIARILARAHGRVIGISPTGRGADCLARSIGAQCYTVHRAIRLAGNESLDLSTFDLVLCDEAGLLDTPTLEMLASALHDSGTRARIVFLGDPGQLPSVGPGRVLEELISSLPTAKLNIVYRYGDINIGLACEYARGGQLIVGHGITTEGDITTAVNVFRNMVNTYGIQETRLITIHSHDSDHFNSKMRYQYTDKPPIVCYKNNYQHNVFNGQCGYIDKSGLHFGDIRLNSDMIKWRYAYGSTCHRAQGGQWDAVEVWIPSARYLTREWLLTACSRAVKSLSIVVRDAATTERCLEHGKSSSRRVSLLSAFLSGKAKWVQ